jgi:hypothetical protein
VTVDNVVGLVLAVAVLGYLCTRGAGDLRPWVGEPLGKLVR